MLRDNSHVCCSLFHVSLFTCILTHTHTLVSDRTYRERPENRQRFARAPQMRESGAEIERVCVCVVCTAGNMVSPQHLAIDEYKWHNKIAKWSGSGKENILSNRRMVFAVILINKNSLRA